MAYDRRVFATLSGAYPTSRPRDPSGRDDEALIREVLSVQAEAGLGLLSDGSVRWPDPIERVGRALLADPDRPHRDGPLTVEAWAMTCDAAGELPVKQAIPGPYTLGRRFAPDDARRARLTLAIADELADELADLAAAGCPFVQVDEPDAVAIGPNAAERALFAEAHHRLLAGLATEADDRPHVSLAIVGGSADEAGPETIFAPSYDSHLFDLIDGPDNWRLITRAPVERGIVLGVADARTPAPDDLAILVWAVGYAASTGRGETRIGVAPSGSLAALDPVAARAKIERLGDLVELIEHKDETPIGSSLDPRTIDARSAALGQWRPRRGDQGGRGGGPPPR